MQLPLQRPRLQIMVISNGLKIWSLTQCGVKESARDVYYKRRIIAVTKLQIVEWHGYKHLDWITVHRDGKLTNLNVEDLLAFGVSLRMFTRSIVIQRRVEDLQLGVESYQKKLNITKSDTYRYDLKRRDAYTAYSNPRGFIYQNKDKKNKLMRIDELHKFSDGTLDDVRTALNDRLKGIRMEYLPHTIWRQSDRERAKSMIQVIDKQLKSRRIMRSLERFVSGRLSNLNIRVISFTMKMEILLEPTSNKLMVGDLCDSIRIKLVTTGKKRWCDSIRIKLVPEHAEFDESDTHVLERFDTSARNPVKRSSLELNLPEEAGARESRSSRIRRILKDGGEGT
ncbi:hypothetical protein Tco_0827007 [Tanacetum coccineum]